MVSGKSFTASERAAASCSIGMLWFITICHLARNGVERSESSCHSAVDGSKVSEP